MTYDYVRTIKGREYLYRQTSYREGGKVKTHYEYVGPLDPKRKKPLGALLGFIQDGARSKKPWEFNEETDEEAQARVARENEARAKQEHVNDILAGPSMTLGQFNEVIAHQAQPPTAPETASEPDAEPSVGDTQPSSQETSSPDTPSSEPSGPSAP